MGHAAEKLTVTPPADEFPKLERGEFLMKGLQFPLQGAWGNRHLLIGQRYDFGFNVSGRVERIIVLPSGAARVYVREAEDQKSAGKLRQFIFYPGGTYGPELVE